MKLIQLLIFILIIIFYQGCGTEESQKIENDAIFAKANIDTAKGFLGSNYTLVTSNNPTNYKIKANTETNGSVQGSKVKYFKANENDKTFVQNYTYVNYINDKNDSICNKTTRYILNGNLTCNGKYSYKDNNNIYHFKNKKCTYLNNFTSKNTSYSDGSTIFYDYENNKRTKNITYTHTTLNKLTKKSNWVYTYSKDETLKIITVDNLSGIYYFDNLKQYIELSSVYHNEDTKNKTDLCNGDIYSGTTYFDTADYMMKFEITTTNIVKVSKLIDSSNSTWEEIAIFKK